MKKPLKYTDQIDEAWAEKAMETIGVSAVPDPLHPVVLDVEGQCPRCAHQMMDEHWLITFRGVAAMSRDDAVRAAAALLSAGVGKDLLPAEFTIQCTCREAHPDALGRAGLKGCGAAWRMRFEVTEETE